MKENGLTLALYQFIISLDYILRTSIDLMKENGLTLALYLLIISLDYILRTSIDLMKENGLSLKMVKSRRYPTEPITDADYTDYQELLANQKSE